MPTKYRAIVDENNFVIAIGYDEGQKGYDEANGGTWTDFTFDTIPELPEEYQDLDNALMRVQGTPRLKVENEQLLFRPIEETTAELPKV